MGFCYLVPMSKPDTKENEMSITTVAKGKRVGVNRDGQAVGYAVRASTGQWRS